LTSIALLAISVALAGATARADDLILSGPHPALKENALAAQFLVGNGLGDSFSGRGVGIGYGYMLQGPLWLDLQMDFRASGCAPFNPCGPHTGDDVELMAGVAWRFRTDIPVVPFVSGAAGLVYLYPNGADSAVGLAIRGAGGLRYYVYDWLGFGVEVALSLGHGYFAQSYPASHGYTVFDTAFGVEYQFR
jgi:hypothetical protein